MENFIGKSKDGVFILYEAKQSSTLEMAALNTTIYDTTLWDLQNMCRSLSCIVSPLYNGIFSASGAEFHHKIIGGEISQRGQWPWMISLRGRVSMKALHIHCIRQLSGIHAQLDM